jgi:hypothetical protein
MSRLASFGIVVCLAGLAGCASHGSDGRGHDGSAAGSGEVAKAPALASSSAVADAAAAVAQSAPIDAAAPAAKVPPGMVADEDGVLHGPLPAAVAPQVKAILDEPVGKHVIVRFVEMAREQSTSVSYRWDLKRSGRLSFVRHGDQPGPVATPFDQPLPDRPSLEVDDKHVKEIFSTLKAQGFWDHPGYELDPSADPASTIVVVEARDPKTREIKTVVYDGSRPDLLDFLEAVTVSL